MAKIQRVYSASGSVVGAGVANPVDGGEGYKGVLAIEVGEDEAARGAEVEDAAGEGDVAVFIRDDLAGDREEVVDGFSEGLAGAALGVVGVRAPEGLRGGEVLVRGSRGSGGPG